MLLLSIIPSKGLSEIGKSTILIAVVFLAISIVANLLEFIPSILRNIFLEKFNTYVYLLAAGICIYIIGKFRSK